MLKLSYFPPQFSISCSYSKKNLFSLFDYFDGLIQFSICFFSFFILESYFHHKLKYSNRHPWFFSYMYFSGFRVSVAISSRLVWMCATHFWLIFTSVLYSCLADSGFWLIPLLVSSYVLSSFHFLTSVLCLVVLLFILFNLILTSDTSGLWSDRISKSLSDENEVYLISVAANRILHY